MTTKEIIDGLKFTVDMFLFNPSTGETLTEPRNGMDKTTIDACKGAIELLEQTDGDLISRQSVINKIAILSNEQGNKLIEAIKDLPSAEKTTINPDKTTIIDTDLISRTELLNKIWRKEYGIDYDGVNLLRIKHIDIIENMPSYNSIKTELNGDLVKENTDLVKKDVENADKKCISEETVSQSLVKDGVLINCEYILKQIEITEEKLNFTFETLKDFIKVLPTYHAEQTDTKQEIGTTNKVLADVFNKIVKMSNDELVELLKLIDNPQTDSVLEDIKAEFIKRYPINYCGEPELGGVSCVFSLNDVLKIIDKYINGKKKKVNEFNIENDLIHRGNALNAITYGKDKNEMQGNILNIPRAEKEIEKQVILSGDGYSNGELVYDFGECPNCGWNFEEGDKDWEEPFCCHCGQKLHWFDK